MSNNTQSTEQLILHAIDVWDREMKQLYAPENGHRCPYCPKRFIYGCFCSFERKIIEEAIEVLEKNGKVRKHVCEGYPDDFGLQKL